MGSIPIQFTGSSKVERKKMLVRPQPGARQARLDRMEKLNETSLRPGALNLGAFFTTTTTHTSMTLSEYIDKLNKFVAENPASLNMEAVYSEDDEGNRFFPVHYTPSTGYYEDNDFVAFDAFEEEDRTRGIVNAVCIN